MVERYFFLLNSSSKHRSDGVKNSGELESSIRVEDVRLHEEMFTKQCFDGERGHVGNVDQVLRSNINYLAEKTNFFGLVLTQLTWSGVINISDRIAIMSQTDDLSRCVALYSVLLKQEPSQLSEIIKTFHMTGNYEIAAALNPVLYEKSKRRASLQPTPEPCIKRQSNKENLYSIAKRMGYKRAEKQLGSSMKSTPVSKVQLIPVEKGMEDNRSCVVLCKCGDYHQLPKWKISSHPYSGSSSSKKNAILHPVDPVEIAEDSLHSTLTKKAPNFTKPRKSCQYFKLKFHSSCKTDDATDKANSLCQLKIQLSSPKFKKKRAQVKFSE